MSREKIYTMLHKLRACTVRQTESECNGNCKECIYAVKSDDVIKMCDTLILMYRPEKKKKKIFRFWKKKGAKK